MGVRQLLVELAPLLLGPAELLDRGCEIEEMDRNDRGAGPQVGVPDEGIQLPAGLDETCVDGSQAFLLLWGVTGPGARQGGAPLGLWVGGV